MQITYVEKISQKKLAISLNNDDRFIIDEKLWCSFGLNMGDHVDGNFIHRLYQEYFLLDAKKKALMLLKMRDHTQKELTDKLKQKGYPNSVVYQAVEYVMSYHYIDDERYAHNYINFRKQNKSKKELLHELSMKGIDSGALKADEFLMDSIDDKASIRNIINKRWKALDLVDLKEKERMTRYLARHGFAASDVFSVYKELGI